MSILSEIRSEIESCTLCPLAATRNNIVFGTGNEKADLVLIGEAPGDKEDREGVPFVGQAGKLLDAILDQVGLKRDEVYIANVLKCRPPDNRNPKKEEIEMCRPYLDRQLDIIEPRVLVTMGNYALNLFTRKRQSISQVHGQLFFHRSIPVIPSYHPAAVLYNRKLEPVLVEDFRNIVNFIASAERTSRKTEQMPLI